MKFHANLFVSILVFLLMIGLGAYAYHQVEGWNGLDSIYFVVVTITTIGYGDLVPRTELGKIFTIFFSFFGIAAAFYFMSLIGAYIFKAHLNEGVYRIRENVKEDLKEHIDQHLKQQLKKKKR